MQQRSSACRAVCAHGHTPTSSRTAVKMMLKTSPGTVKSPTPQRFSGDDSLHETIPANGLHLNHNPYACNLRVPFPAPASEGWAMVSNYHGNFRFFYYTKCDYFTGLYLEISAQTPCDSEYSGWDRSRDTRRPK